MSRSVASRFAPVRSQRRGLTFDLKPQPGCVMKYKFLFLERVDFSTNESK